MSTTQVRERFHSLIDDIKDADRLKHLFDALSDANIVPHEVTDELTDEQRGRLVRSLEQVKVGDVLPHETVKNQISEWLSR